MPSPVALITGGSSGIGLALARVLSARGYGLTLVGRHEATLRAAVPDALRIVADLEDPAAAAAAVDRCVGEFGRLDALVNNAGWSPAATIPQTTPELAARVFALNAVAPTVTIARAWPAFVRQFESEGRGGVVVNVSSMATKDPYPILYAYAAAKSAVNNLALSVAIQGRAFGVRGFSVAPGAVETPLLRSLVPESSLPSSRTLRPEHVAGVVAACIAGERDADNGQTIFLPSP